MKPISSKNQKIPFSLDPAYQLIWRSLIWFFLLIAIFSASTYQALNWITPVSILFSGILFSLKKGTYLKFESSSLSLHYFLGLKKLDYPLNQIKEVRMSESNRIVQLYSDDAALLDTFYLSKKQQKVFTELLKKHPYKVTVFIESERMEEE